MTRDLILKTTANNIGDKLMVSVPTPTQEVGPEGRNINYRVTNIPESVEDAEVIKLFDSLMGIAYGRWTFTFSELQAGKYINRLEAL